MSRGGMLVIIRALLFSIERGDGFAAVRHFNTLCQLDSTGQTAIDLATIRNSLTVLIDMWEEEVESRAKDDAS